MTLWGWYVVKQNKNKSLLTLFLSLLNEWIISLDPGQFCELSYLFETSCQINFSTQYFIINHKVKINKFRRCNFEIMKIFFLHLYMFGDKHINKSIKNISITLHNIHHLHEFIPKDETIVNAIFIYLRSSLANGGKNLHFVIYVKYSHLAQKSQIFFI